MENQKCALVGLIGAPNVGKSTLINALVGQKISIVTPKVQTTRTVINGISIMDDCQLIFVDTPGIFTPRSSKNLEKAIVRGAWRGVEDVDVYAMIVDVTKGFCDNSEIVIENLKKKNKKIILLVNKMDMLKKKSGLNLEEIVKKFDEHGVFDKIILISALKGTGIDLFKQYLCEIAPPGPWHYPEDEISSVPQKFLISEIVREKLFMRLNQELPYSITVETEHYERFDNGDIKVHQIIFVSKENHKMIVLGKNGEMIKKIGHAARKELESVLGVKVHLFLFLKVKENWQDDPEKYKYMGLDF